MDVEGQIKASAEFPSYKFPEYPLEERQCCV
jgi:hypothetical protein